MLMNVKLRFLTNEFGFIFNQLQMQICIIVNIFATVWFNKIYIQSQNRYVQICDWLISIELV